MMIGWDKNSWKLLNLFFFFLFHNLHLLSEKAQYIQIFKNASIIVTQFSGFVM